MKADMLNGDSELIYHTGDQVCRYYQVSMCFYACKPLVHQALSFFVASAETQYF